jgi:hypothetical protein
MPDDKRDDPAFLYFPSNYRWSMGLLICLSAAPWTGIEIDEVNRVGRALANKVGDDPAWFEEWARMGEKIEARGRDALRASHKLTAASCFMRATRYYQTGERFIHPRSQRSMDVYARSVTLFKDAAAMIRRPRIETVEVPYENTSLPALLVHPDREATGSRPAPAMIFFDGFDVTKELQYGYGIPDLAARGIGCLIVDGPGNGESVRFRNLPLIAETENYATPAYEYLAARDEFDPTRIGVMALSLGGYYAPRAASLEPRFATRFGHAVWKNSIPARSYRFRCRPSTCNGCWAFPTAPRPLKNSKVSGSTASCKRWPARFYCCTAPAMSRYRLSWPRNYLKRRAPSRRRSKSSAATRAAFIIARSTILRSAYITCSTGSPT